MTFKLLRLTCVVCTVFAAPAKAQDADLISAAKTVLSGIQIDSFLTGREYCGMIGRNKRGKLVVTHPSAGTAGSCRPRNLSIFRGRVDEIASYHTHGSHDPRMDSEVPSFEDFRADKVEGVYGFVSTPGGRLWVIDPKGDQVRLVCGPGCMPVDANYRASDTGPIRKRYSSKQLKDRAHGHSH